MNRHLNIKIRNYITKHEEGHINSPLLKQLRSDVTRMMEAEMKPGDKVKIYADPITKQDYEGEAVLMAEYRTDDTGDGLSMWIVIFDDEPEQLSLF